MFAFYRSATTDRAYVQNGLQIVNALVDVAHSLLFSLVMVLLSLNLLHGIVIASTVTKRQDKPYPVLKSIAGLSSTEFKSIATQGEKTNGDTENLRCGRIPGGSALTFMDTLTGWCDERPFLLPRGSSSS